MVRTISGKCTLTGCRNKYILVQVLCENDMYESGLFAKELLDKEVTEDIFEAKREEWKHIVEAIDMKYNK